MGEDDIKLEQGKLYFEGKEIPIKSIEIKAIPAEVQEKVVNGIKTSFVILKEIVIKFWNYIKQIFIALRKHLREKHYFNNRRNVKRRWQQIYKAIRLSYK